MSTNKNLLLNLINEAVEKAIINEAANPIDEAGKELLIKYVGWLRALHLWFHGAHHVTSGPSFAGDHVNLYGIIYEEIQAEIDGAIEKIIGVTNDSSLACPTCLINKTSEILNMYQSPTKLSPTSIANVGLQLEKDYIQFVEYMFESLELKGMLTLGFNDQLAGSVNVHEKYIYLLQQRTKKNFEEY